MINSKEIAENFIHWDNFLAYRIKTIKYSLARKLLKGSLPIFLRGRDVISVDPFANGVYEPEIKSLIEHFAKCGYDDFLIDIGANIGLTSCQSGLSFKEVHMFEPNQNASQILKINSKIALGKHNYKIHEYGLGVKKDELDLYIPYTNWGGAFIRSKDNSYDDSTLSHKDGFDVFNSENYEIVKVKIEPTNKIISDIFKNLKTENPKGVIKIDAEGYEESILNDILDVTSQNTKMAIILENWNSKSKILSSLNNNSNKYSVYKLSINKSKYIKLPKWFNTIINFFKGGFDTKLTKIQSKVEVGTLLIIN